MTFLPRIWFEAVTGVLVAMASMLAVSRRRVDR
jgi:hypothetical protein